uniref:Putative ABC transporter periplasmic binding protein n=1 Tax=Magnetococcus massalia (strain MO-1) TaxID=451514 RepID=A0A1S7LCH3_MAGMO|nr:putative ABC transporter periplasmic binding protein [Candidatus Magnetococcus massalia]
MVRGFSFYRRFTLLLCALLGLLQLPATAWAAADEPLRIGVFPRRSAQLTTTMFQPMAELLSQQLKRPVVVEAAPDFPTFWQRLAAHRYDLVHLNQYQYIKAHAKHGYRVIARNEEFGRDTLTAAFFVRKDRKMNSLQQLRGKKVIFGGGRGAMIGYIIPTQMLRQAGLEAGSYQELFAKTPPNAIIATYFNQADAGCAGDIGLNLVANKIDVEALEILAQSEPLVLMPWAIKGDLPAELSGRITSILTGLQHSDAGRKVLKAARLTALRPAQDRDYAPLRQIVAEVLDEHY